MDDLVFLDPFFGLLQWEKVKNRTFLRKCSFMLRFFFKTSIFHFFVDFRNFQKFKVSYAESQKKGHFFIIKNILQGLIKIQMIEKIAKKMVISQKGQNRQKPLINTWTICFFWTLFLKSYSGKKPKIVLFSENAHLC